MLTKRLLKELQTINAKELDRHITDLQYENAVVASDRTGKKYVVFSSNNYLGLTFNESVRKAASQAALNLGTGSTGSRLTTGGFFAATDLEKELAHFKHAEAALIFNTGYMTNLGVLFALVSKDDVIFSDELNHASIIDGCRISKGKVIIYKHNDMQDLKQKLQQFTDTYKDQEDIGTKFIVTDGVFSMDGDIANLPELVRLKKQYGAVLMVDDAHSVGVLGADGSGTAAHYNLQGQVDIQVGTLSKSLASEGGYVASTQVVIDYLRNKSRPFIFSTFLSPADIAAALAALKVLQTEGHKYLQALRDNTKFLRDALTNAGLPVISGTTPIVPVVVHKADLAVQIDHYLREEGFLVSAIRPPTVPANSSRLRITVTAAHTQEQLKNLAGTLIKFWQQISETEKGKA